MGEEPEFGPVAGLAPKAAVPEQPVPAEYAARAASAFPQTSLEKDIQLLSAKLDALKAILDNINQRLANIERIAQEAQESEKYERY